MNLSITGSSIIACHGSNRTVQNCACSINSTSSTECAFQRRRASLELRANQLPHPIHNKQARAFDPLPSPSQPVTTEVTSIGHMLVFGVLNSVGITSTYNETRCNACSVVLNLRTAPVGQNLPPPPVATPLE